MNQSLPLEASDFIERAVSPSRELGAYEALWARSGMTFKKIADMFRACPESVPSDFVSEAEIEEFTQKVFRQLEHAGIDRFGVRVHGAGEYPKKLRDADHPIELLYFQGWWDLVRSPCAAVVGTRNPTEDGRRRTRKIARMLVKHNYTVVSGLASGVDTEAHAAAIKADGHTIAVLGTPLAESYPKENKKLQDFIAKEHLVISQVPIIRYSMGNPRSNRLFFPERNVTMSALTAATIIVEAGETSGTHIQARHAIKQGRGLFILDSCFRKGLAWPEKFLKQGAKRITDEDQLLELLENAANKD